MTFDLRAQLMVDMGNWQRSLTKASNQTKSFGKSVKTVANGVKGAIAFMGINAITGGLTDAAKAADEDAKSQRVLNKVLVNSWKATEQQTKAVDEFIQKTSQQVGILDDELRPAFAKIATTTKNPTKAMDRFRLALDVAAGTGKDLNVVSQAMAKYFGGQTTALDKLVPGIKDAGDKIGYMTKQYNGAAEAGAGAFDKINVAIENAKESIGAKLLPEVEKFAKWLGSDEGQKAMQQWIGDLKNLIDLAGQFLGVVREVTDIFKGKFTKDTPGKTPKAPTQFQNLSAATKNEVLGRTGNMATGGNTYITVNAPNVSGAAVLTAINGEARRKGVPLSKLLG
jgi:hypothetical protein